MPSDAAVPVSAASARARSNIALVKYWGKRDSVLNLPASGSLSITLDALSTRTRVQLEPGLEQDALSLDGADAVPAPPRVRECLDLLRDEAGSALRARVVSYNDFPTGAGLASSASGFAALVLAGAAALGLELDRTTLSRAARRGSGSAARSLFGGFVEMAAGIRADGADACARPLLAADAWPLEVVVAVTQLQPKSVGSGMGMEASRRSSPYYRAWLEGADTDLAAARAAVLARDFDALAWVSEHSCMKMHAVMLASDPPLLYWNGATLACIECVRRLREEQGLAVFFTIDAGPQVKAVCAPGVSAAVARALRAVPGVHAVIQSALGPGAEVVAEPHP